MDEQLPLLRVEESPIGDAPHPYSEDDLRFARSVRLAKAMLEIGVSEDQVTRLLTSYPHDLIEAQLEWLPHRKAKKKASMLVSSIVRNYEPPTALYEEAE